MITGTRPLRQTPRWQLELAQAITDRDQLLRTLDLDPTQLPPLAPAPFPLRVPRGYVARMRKGDLDDPLLRQVLPLACEAIPVPGFHTDPVGDLSAMVVPGLLHKYRGRVLLTATGACAIHCRYCFRRHFPYAEANPGTDHWAQALAYIGGDASISEVILSGGDPLTLSDRRLGELLQHLAGIPHVARLRIHTRLPIVLPERITPELAALLTQTRLQTVVVVHANHAHEIDGSVRTALAVLKATGAMLLNQSVLLSGVNDDADSLAALSLALFAAGVVPYYLHLLDKVEGAAHFDVAEPIARALHAQLSARLPGYLVPRLVREEVGAPGKTALA